MDVQSYVGGNFEQHKRRPLKCNRSYLNGTYDDVRDLMVFDWFLLTSCRYLYDEEFDHYRSAITNALIEHPDTNRFYREPLRNRGNR